MNLSTSFAITNQKHCSTIFHPPEEEGNLDVLITTLAEILIDAMRTSELSVNAKNQ